MEVASMEQMNSDAGLKDLLLGIYCDIDDFCKGFEEYWHTILVADGKPVMPRCAMSLAEIMSIVVFFPSVGSKDF